MQKVKMEDFILSDAGYTLDDLRMSGQDRHTEAAVVIKCDSQRFGVRQEDDQL
jgi:hypothetical protein